MYGRMLNMIIFRLVFILTVASVGLCNFKILLLHTSDMHSRFDEVNVNMDRCQTGKCYGGFARLRAEIERLRSEAKARGVSTVYLDAGDVFGESVYFKEFGWRLVVTMMNLLKPDAVSLGSSEFDSGLDDLGQYLKYLRAPVVCSNLDTREEPQILSLGDTRLMPSTVLNLNGVLVGIVGYTSTHMPPKKIGNLKFLDEISMLKEEVRKLKEVEKVKVVIALGHAGYYKDIEIAKEVDNIDVIVGGRTHYFLYTGKPPSVEKPDGPYPTIAKRGWKKVPIVHASYGTKYLGHIELEFNNKGKLVKYSGQPILLKGEMEQDQEVLNTLAPYKSTISSKYQQVLGRTEVLFDGKNSICRFQECNIGNLITDAFVDAMNSRYQTTDGKKAAHIGIIDSRDISSSLYPKSEEYSGDIVLEDVIAVLPFSRNLMLLKVSGNVLRGLLESALSTYDADKGGLFKACLFQVSGLRLQYDLSKTTGNRLTKVQVGPNCVDGTCSFDELDDSVFYNLVMPEFLADGGDQMKCITPELKAQTRFNIPRILEDNRVVAEYIQKKSILTGEEYAVQGRIKIIEPKTPKSYNFVSRIFRNIRDRIKRLLGRA